MVSSSRPSPSQSSLAEPLAFSKGRTTKTRCGFAACEADEGADRGRAQAPLQIREKPRRSAKKRGLRNGFPISACIVAEASTRVLVCRAKLAVFPRARRSDVQGNPAAKNENENERQGDSDRDPYIIPANG